jgi:3-oxoacyl-[acyl-carrier-protein] synthase-1
MGAQTSQSSALVTSIGMVTCVGHGAIQACSSLRAGIARIRELEEPPPGADEFEWDARVGAPVDGVTDGLAGIDRYMALGAHALGDLIETAGLSRTELDTTGLYIALPPETRDGFDPVIREMLPKRIADCIGGTALEHRTQLYLDGHAATARASLGALADLESGRFSRAIVCGVDSWLEQETLECLAEHRRLKTAEDPDGFVPGEAAACFLLEPAVSDPKTAPLARLEAVATATEPHTIWSPEPSAATGLSESIRATLTQLDDGGAETGLIVCDLNGESYRAREFGNTLPRVMREIAAGGELWHPADCIGDIGAASFALSVCIGARALERGYANGGGVLVWGSSDDGLRGSLYLKSA